MLRRRGILPALIAAALSMTDQPVAGYIPQSTPGSQFRLDNWGRPQMPADRYGPRRRSHHISVSSLKRAKAQRRRAELARRQRRNRARGAR